MSYNATPSPKNNLETELIFSFVISTIIAVLSPVAVAGNALILAAVWKKTFVRTPFHVLLSGLAFTDLYTGLIAQPFYVLPTLMYWVNPVVVTKESLPITIGAIGKSSAADSISVTTLLIALMSVERWLHMSRRSLVTTRRGCFAVVILLLIPIPIVVCCALWTLYQRYRAATETMIITVLLSSYLTTSFACFKVYRIIRHHQQQVQANESSRNSERQAIDLAKYKRSVASMLYIVVLLSFCFLPYVPITAVKLSLGDSFGIDLAQSLSSVPVFLSSSFNPGLYLWRMKDIRNGVKQLFC